MFTKKRSAGTDFESNASTPPPPPLRPISSGCRGDDECSGVSSASDGRQVCGTRCACKSRHQGIGLCDPNICHCNCDIPGLRPFKTNLVPLLGLAIQDLSTTLSQSQTNSTPATTKKRGPKKRGTSSRRNNVNESSADHSAASRIFNTVQRASQPVPADEAKQSNVASIQSAVASSPSPTFILLTALQQQARAIDSVNQRLGVIGQLSIKNAEALNRMGFIQSDIQHSIHRYLASSSTNTFIPSNIPPNSSSSSASLHPSPSSSAPSSDPHDHHRSNNDSNNQSNRSSLQQLLQHLITISGRSAEICEKIIMELLKKSRLNAFTAAELMEAAKVAGIDINHL